MPHFKCVTCKTRVHNRGGPAGLCRGCGSAFEPVRELSELVGFQAQDRLDAERWIDDGGSAIAEAVAMPRPDTTH